MNKQKKITHVSEDVWLQELKRELQGEDDSASYCCESAEVVPAEDIPEETPFS